MTKQTEINHTFLNEVTILHAPTANELLQKGLGNALALYSLYCHTGGWQRTDKVKASTSFCRKALGWGSQRFNNAKKQLVDLKIIEQVVRKDKNNKITGYYIKIHKSQLTRFPHVENESTNAFSIQEKKVPTKSGTSVLSKKQKPSQVTLPYEPLYPDGFPMFLDMPENKMPKSPEEAREMVNKWKDIETEGDAKNSLSPVTIEEVLHLCHAKRLYYNDVIGKWHNIVELINEGIFQKKYPHHKTTYYTLGKWLQMDIDRGYLQPMSDVAEFKGHFEKPDGYLLPANYKERKMYRELRERKLNERKTT